MGEMTVEEMADVILAALDGRADPTAHALMAAQDPARRLEAHALAAERMRADEDIYVAFRSGQERRR